MVGDTGSTGLGVKRKSLANAGFASLPFALFLKKTGSLDKQIDGVLVHL